MYDLYNDLTEMCFTLSEELRKTNDKLERAGGSLSAGDLEYIDKLTHALKSVKTTKAMVDADDEMGYSGDRSYASNNRGGGRSSRGRMMYPRYNYSGDENMIHELRELMESAPNEETRRQFDKFIKKMEQM